VDIVFVPNSVQTLISERKERLGGIILECKLLEQCQFYNKKNVAMHVDMHVDMAALALITLMKMRYCTGGGSCACARYVLSRKLGGKKIPDHLLPNQLNKVREILGFL